MSAWKEGAAVYKVAARCLFAAVILFALSACFALAEEDGLPEELTPEEIREERYYTLVDEKAAEILTQTGRRLFPGDEYLTADNRLFEIYRVKEYTAYARYRETLELPAPARQTTAVMDDSPAEPRGLIAIFHTHNAESYVPTDGTDSIYGRGGVHDVGDAFQQALQERGVRAIHNEQMHLPHDRSAYLRARDTVLELMEEQPDAIFDIHRDAAPPEMYTEKIEGELLAQIQFVVGTQNPSMASNRQFAYDLKGYADQMYPNLVRGVLFNNGSYNQDLYPTKLLLEVGSHLTEREQAEESIVFFSDIVAFYFYGPAPVQQEREEEGARAAGRSAATLLALLGGGLLLFYFLNRPGSVQSTVRTFRKILDLLAAELRFRLTRAWQAILPLALRAKQRVLQLRKRKHRR